jgi:formylglycine-generating enzyme required for sulfatase activity
MTPLASIDLDRSALLDRFRTMRRRTEAMFDLLDERVYYERPIALRNPVVFYEGHLPAFAVNTLIKRALGRPGIDAELETIFARGIDPETEANAVARGNPAWPSRSIVRQYATEADRLIADAIASADLHVAGNPLLDRAQALWAILEHEEMHQETLAYMWHELPYAVKQKPDGYDTTGPAASATLRASTMRIPAGTATIGTGDEAPFAWDNERPSHRVRVEAFAIDVHDVTNAEFMDFIDATGRPAPHFWQQEDGVWYWRGMFERIPLPPSWPVYVTWEEANAYAAWRGRRLPTEPEFHRAAYGDPAGVEHRLPGGDEHADEALGNFDFARWDPEPVGAHPTGVSAFGVHDLIGNGWEWTASPFGPFNGFEPLPSYPEYSADFFDGDHYVMKGASPMTARALVRPGFRNWFRPSYPYVYATFRCVEPA